MAGTNFSHKPTSVKKVNTDYRKIITKIPVPESIPLLERIYETESRSMHGQIPIVWDKALGFQVYDKWGNKWLDFSSTIFVANAGHSNSRIVDSLKKLLEKPLLQTYNFSSPERFEYLDYLIQNTPNYFEKAFMLSAGTEATEAVLKLMRLNGLKYTKRKKGIICFEGNWHGRTMGAQMMGWSPEQKEWIGYLDPNIYHIPFPYKHIIKDKDPKKFLKDSLDKLFDEQDINPKTDICGVMMETFQGWGACFYPKEYVQEISKFCKANQILLSFDEMQAGFGRTGQLFGYMHYNVEPDLIACGKGSSSSLPLSIVLGKSKLMDLPDIGSMSSTHSANPMVCAAGKANLEALIEDGLIDNSKELGIKFHAELNEIQETFPDYISEINGIGLLAAVIFRDKNFKPLSKLCDMISEKCFQKGLLVVHTGRESIKLAPPLMINERAMSEGLNVFKEAIEESIRDFYD
jgi:4-aminobutyrate aminotransferase-like enzyme